MSANHHPNAEPHGWFRHRTHSRQRRAAEARIRTPDLCLQPQRLIGTQLALNQPKLELQLLAPGLQLHTISLG